MLAPVPHRGDFLRNQPAFFHLDGSFCIAKAQHVEPRPLSRQKLLLLRIHALPSRFFFPLALAFLAPEPSTFTTVSTCAGSGPRTTLCIFARFFFPSFILLSLMCRPVQALSVSISTPARASLRGPPPRSRRGVSTAILISSFGAASASSFPSRVSHHCCSACAQSLIACTSASSFVLPARSCTHATLPWAEICQVECHRQTPASSDPRIPTRINAVLSNLPSILSTIREFFRRSATTIS